MKRTLILLIATIYCIQLKAQSILHDSILHVGFYKNIFELVYNEPSEPFDYTINERVINTSKGFKGHKIPIYNLAIQKDSTKLIGDVFGFCDGKNIYLKTINTGAFADYKSKKFSPKSNFVKINEIGIYTYFKDIKKGNSGPMMMYTGGGAMGGAVVGIGASINTGSVYAEYIINLKTNEIEMLTVKNLKKLLADQPNLLNEFNGDKDKKKNFEKYILKYNESYKSNLEE